MWALYRHDPPKWATGLQHHITCCILNPEAALQEMAKRNKDVRGEAGIKGVPMHAAHEVARQGDAGETAVRRT